MTEKNYLYLFKQRFDVNLTIRQVLKSVFGLGVTKINFILDSTNLLGSSKIGTISKLKLDRLEAIASSFVYGKEYNKLVRQKFLKVYLPGSYKELRLSQRLPTNGQRTRCNARTSKSLHSRLYSNLIKIRGR